MNPTDAAVLVVNKPRAISSFDVIRKLRPHIGKTRVGHAGTLDPLADGVLLVCMGRATRLVVLFQDLPKHYRARVRLGTITDSDDLDGKVISRQDVSVTAHLATIKSLLPRFQGRIEQVPPQFSALKVDGERAYRLARAGKKASLQPRTVHVYELELLSWEGNELDLSIRCSRGTYIRAIARDLGQALGCGACLAGLTRTAIGHFGLERALAVADFNRDNLEQACMDPATALDFLPEMSIPAVAEPRILNGQPLSQVVDVQGTGYVRVMGESGRLLAVVQRASEQDQWKYLTVCNLP